MGRMSKAFVLNEMEKRKDRRNHEYDNRMYDDRYEDYRGYDSREGNFKGYRGNNYSPSYPQNNGIDYSNYDGGYYNNAGSMPTRKGYGAEYYPMYGNMKHFRGQERREYERHNDMPYYGMGYIDIDDQGGYGDSKNYNIYGAMGDMSMKANINNMKMNERMAVDWATNMDYTTGEHGPKWKPNEVKPFADKFGFSYGTEKFWCFYAIMNAMYADYGKTMKKHGCEEPEVFAELAKDFIDDDDAVKNKTMIYYNFIAEH